MRARMHYCFLFLGGAERSDDQLIMIFCFSPKLDDLIGVFQAGPEFASVQLLRSSVP